MIRVSEDHGVVANGVAGDVVVVGGVVDDGGVDGGGIAYQAMAGDSHLFVHTYSLEGMQSVEGLDAPVQGDHRLDDDMKDEIRMRGRMNLGSTGQEE